MAKVLFCEDDSLIRKMIGVMLRGSEHEVVIAADGDEGLALLESERPDVVFTDRWMPGVDGLALCDAVKARPEFAHIPVILVTASIEDDERAEALRHGVSAVLQKPFTMAELRAQVERFA